MNELLPIGCCAGVIASAFLADIVTNSRTVARVISPGIPVPFVGIIGLLFGLFVGFNSSEIKQRETGLQLAIEREVNAARSILNFAAGVGPTADSVRHSTLEYLEVVTTMERNWLEHSPTSGTAPGETQVYALALNTAVFVDQAQSSDVIKSLLAGRVDELTSARAERLARMKPPGGIIQWVVLVALAALTQLTAAFSQWPHHRAAATFLALYTTHAVIAIGYLAWADNAFVSGAVRARLAPFEVLLTQSRMNR